MEKRAASPRKFLLINALPLGTPVPDDYQAAHDVLAATAAYIAEQGQGRVLVRWCQEKGAFCLISPEREDLSSMSSLVSINVVPKFMEMAG